jgi:AcrR family transcriptional regulator
VGSIRNQPLRQTREQELVAATRALFDERGFQDVPVEEIARTVGIARGLIYRTFSSKDELFALTVTDYLGELAELLETAAASESRPRRRLERVTEAFAGYCRRYPAFLDSSLALMHRPAGELQAIVSDSVWLRLGQGMAGCLGVVAEVLRDGTESGDFDVADPDYTANLLWTQALGLMHLARIGVGVRRVAPGVPGLFTVESDQVVRSCVAHALAIVGSPPPTRQDSRAKPRKPL